jgi:pilus assembly protein FimV
MLESFVYFSRRMRRFLTPVALLAALGAVPNAADALGFVRGSVNSQLGQPLDFTAVLRVEPDETIARECIVADVTPGDVRLPGAAVRVSLQPGRAPNERIVRVTTAMPIDEPVVSIDIVAGCSGRLTRNFVAFVDPPGLNLATTPAPLEPASPVRAESPVAAAVEAAREASGAAAPAAAASAVAPRQATPRPAPAVRPAPARPRAVAQPRTVTPADAEARRPRTTTTTARAPSGGGARLQLDPAAALVARAPASAPAPAPVPAAVAAPAPVAAAASAASTPEQLLASAAQNEQAQRIAQLEQSIAKMRADAEAAQARVASLQAELTSARETPAGNRLAVILLGALAAVLALAALLLWQRQRRQSPQPQWWTPPDSGVPSAAPAVPSVAPAATPAVRVAEAGDRDTIAELRAPETRPVPRHMLEPPAPEPMVPPRELSVEELIDLEQQADFFVVLGQDEAAIDLLTSHIRSSGGTSPLPFLKLLEIYGRRGDRESYERTRDRFNRRFSAYAPEWGADLAQGKGLEDYPDVIERLVQTWSEPDRVMEAMDAWIFRRESQARTFDLPAYREVLFLYAIARDLLQTPVPADAAPPPVPQPGDRVDFVLPSEPPAPGFAEQTLPLLADEPEAYRSTVVPTQMLRVDIDLTDPAGPESDFSGLVDPGRRG